MKHKTSSLAAFFFQAEDGIRDYKVTGVQTCALPICEVLRRRDRRGAACHRDRRRFRDNRRRLPAGGAGGRERGVEGKRVDLGGGRIIKKKKKKRVRRWRSGDARNNACSSGVDR